jgi:carbon dioxide concentrating mechanism protein CcmN
MSSHLFHLEPIDTTQSFQTGDVVVGEGVAIAPGVLLQADPGSRIVLATGVCLGLGCVVHANGGEIRVDRGANLGAGVLLVGQGIIGAGALVGAGTSILNDSVAAGALIAPGSWLVGKIPQTDVTQTDVTPKVAAPVEATPAPAPAPEPTPAPAPTAPSEPPVSTFVYPDDNHLPKHPWADTSEVDLASPAIPDPWAATAQATAYSPYKKPDPIGQSEPIAPNPDSDLSAEEMQDSNGYSAVNNNIPPNNTTSDLVQRSPKQVYGQSYVNQMLGKMQGK